MYAKTYIVRVYRYDKESPKNIVGMVEDVEGDDAARFTCFDELKTALEHSCGKDADKKHGRRKP